MASMRGSHRSLFFLEVEEIGHAGRTLLSELHENRYGVSPPRTRGMTHGRREVRSTQRIH